MNHYKHLDYYAKQAKRLGYRSRAAFKLMQIDDKYKITQNVRCAVDLGCAPGGWLQVLRERMGTLPSKHPHREGKNLSIQPNTCTQPSDRTQRGGSSPPNTQDMTGVPNIQAITKPQPNSAQGVKIVGIDTSYTAPINGVEVLRGDATDPAQIALLSKYKPQLVVSDMAPSTTGFTDLDHRDSIHLCYVALDFARATLNSGGSFVCKVFEGAEDRELFSSMERTFAKVKRVKPDASRSHSRETYFLGLKKL